MCGIRLGLTWQSVKCKLYNHFGKLSQPFKGGFPGYILVLLWYNIHFLEVFLPNRGKNCIESLTSPGNTMTVLQICCFINSVLLIYIPFYCIYVIFKCLYNSFIFSVSNLYDVKIHFHCVELHKSILYYASLFPKEALYFHLAHDFCLFSEGPYWLPS